MAEQGRRARHPEAEARELAEFLSAGVSAGKFAPGSALEKSLGDFFAADKDGARKLADPIEPETETDPDAEVTTITTLENGDVRVERKYFDGEAMQTMSRDFRAVGAYVHQVYPNGATAQICEGLQLRGPALMAGDDLAATIRATLK